jgi:hypothetical protein
MNRPAYTQYVIGSAVSVTAMVGVTAFVAFRWCTQQEHGESISWIVPAVALCATRAAVRARARVSTYKNWKRSWQAMSGVTPQRKARSTAARLSWAIAVILWAALLGWLVPHQDEKSTQLVVVTFAWLLLTAWGVGAAAWGVLRWAFPRARPPAPVAERRERKREELVEVCVGVPWAASPSLRRIRATLPDYCKALLAREERSDAVSGNAPNNSVQWN